MVSTGNFHIGELVHLPVLPAHYGGSPYKSVCMVLFKFVWWRTSEQYFQHRDHCTITTCCQSAVADPREIGNYYIYENRILYGQFWNHACSFKKVMFARATLVFPYEIQKSWIQICIVDCMEKIVPAGFLDNLTTKKSWGPIYRLHRRVLILATICAKI